ncbi:MAG: insulinase family protein [Kamptonema sp. SIO4C4]|nr:insulinase family protein [Kamptonema sp. SIO4C4]
MPIPHLHRTVLDNGITVIAVENQAADIIAARLFLRAGGRWETLDQAGVFHLMAATMTKGTANYSSVEIAEKVESIGAELGTSAAADYFLLGLKTVTPDFPEMFSLAREILRSPTFPDSEVALEQQLTLQNIKAQQERPFNLAFFQLREAMYPEHPYSTSILGTEATVSQLTPEVLAAYHQHYFRPDNLIVSISGRIDPDTAIAAVQEFFGDWKPPQTEMITPKLPSITAQPRRDAIAQPSQQSIVMLGYHAPAVQKQQDYRVLKLVNTYLANGLSSRLFVELREKRGLAYDVSGFYPTRIEPSQFVVYMGTAPDNTQIAIDGLREEVERLCETPLLQEELQAAKNKLIGQYALGKQTNTEIAQMFGWYETIGVGIEFDQTFPDAIAQITPDRVQEVAQRYFSVPPYVSLVGPEKYVLS